MLLFTSHTQGLNETISILRNRRPLDWPRVDDAATAEKVAVLLLADFEYLLQRTQALARECEQGMATLANSSALEAWRRSADMMMRVQRLTIIGTIFISLSFVYSAWGMNFKELGTSSQPIRMFFPSAALVILLSYLVYRWHAVIRLYHKIT